ncbi:MAG: GNAT family N-acetyltransferase [Ruminococcus sp.]|nr:GNAT family N-acetyltransferase [Ruminococcus sp.]MDD5889692.1 GNAT family N-acetyltransferase [Ruminococcus sp.]
MSYPLFYKEVVMIRKAVVEDLPYIKEIYNDAVRNTTATFDITEKGDDFFRTMFDEHSGKRIFYVYEKDNKAVAYVTLSKFSHRDAYDTTVELSVYVNKDYRHQHIATELM